MKTVLRLVLPELLMIAIMASLALAFMSPVIEGKILYQNDIVQAQNMANELVQFKKQTGEYSAWTNSAFSGMPAYQIKSVPSGNIFLWFFRMLRLYLPGYTVAILFVCMLGFYFLLRTLKLNHWLALAGAVAFGFGSHNLQLIGAGHVSKIYAVAYMAPVIAGVFLVFRRKYLLGGLLTAVGFGIQLVTNHPQVSYYLGIIILIYMLVELVFAIREKYFDHLVKSGIVLFVALLLAILPNMTALMTTQEYSKETTRGVSELIKPGETKTKGLDVNYITDWSYGIGETINLFIPNFSGGGSSQDLGTNSAMYKAMISNQVPKQEARQYARGISYWGSQDKGTAGPHYIGAISVFLAVLGLFIVKGKKKWWLVSIIVFSIVLAWGRNFMILTEFFVNNVPLYAKFRDVTNTLIIAQFAIPLLAFLAIREWFADEQTDLKVKLKKLYIAVGIAGGVAVLVVLIPSIFGSFSSVTDADYPDWLKEALREDRIGLARRDAFRTLIFVICAAGILWYSLKSKIRKEYLYVGLALLILVDMWSVGKRYLNNDNFISNRQIEQAFKSTPADDIIAKDKGQGYRVLDMTTSPFQSAHTSRFHKSIGGYHGAKLGRYQDLIDKYLAPNTVAMGTVFQDKPTLEKIDAAVAGMKVLNLLNTKYIIVNPNGQPFLNSHTYGDVWFVDRVKWVENANEELDALGTASLTDEAVVDKRFKQQLSTLPAQLPPNTKTDVISLIECKPNYLKYDTKATDNRLAVFSQIYYRYGWQAFIDGKKAEYIRADYAMRAMVIPGGQHTVEFRFEPKTLKTGRMISLIGSLLVLLLIIGTVVVELRSKKEE
ncbi:MAG: YfhO family protein [Bacteroidia bacterium]|nr:YfhO family protein [Bacteroidia bacterium]